MEESGERSACALLRWAKRRGSFGVVRGSPASDVVVLPRALPEVEIARIAVGSGGQSEAETAREMVAAYREAGSGAFMGALLRRHHDRETGAWSASMLLAVRTLRKVGASGRGYVEHVCAASAKLHGKFPFPEQVFGAKAVRGWTRSYLAGSAEVLRLTTYQATRERRLLYRERIERGAAKLPLDG